jgi:NAD(P)-dependent dehydrogenase (short-subunit alcohol dehydrogenase family)
MTKLSGRTAIVTGSTWVDPGGLNIGGAVAAEIVREGGRVVLADINIAGAAALAKRLNESSSDGTPVAAAHEVDIRREDDLRRLVTNTVEQFGGVDILVNAAGIFPPDDGDVASMTIEVWDNVMAVNVRGAMLLTKHVLPHFFASGRGAIVNTASTHAFAGDLSLTGYGASKAALNALTVYTATQYGSRGVRCNGICPGTTLSPPALALPPEAREIFERHTLNPRLNRPEDLAKAYLFLVSDDAVGLNGMVVRVDGGLLAHQPFSPDFAALSA